MDSQQVYKLLKYLERKVNDIPINIYILIWAVTDMYKRIQLNKKEPKFIEITYPFSLVPLFTLEEAQHLEKRWNEVLHDSIFSDIFDSYESIFDSLHHNVSETTINLTTHESIDEKSNKYISSIPIIFEPNKTVIPIISTFLEVLYILYSSCERQKTKDKHFSKNILMLLSTCITIMSDTIYNTILSTLDFVQDNPKYFDCIVKILKDTLLLIPSDLRIYVKDLINKPSNEFICGFSIWLFTIMEPHFIKENISHLLGTKIEDIPNVRDLYILQNNINKLFNIPENINIIKELKEVPPYNVFLNLEFLQKDNSEIYNSRLVLFKRNKSLKSRKY